jgi:hypothetical protein
VKKESFIASITGWMSPRKTEKTEEAVPEAEPEVPVAEEPAAEALAAQEAADTEAPEPEPAADEAPAPLEEKSSFMQNISKVFSGMISPRLMQCAPNKDAPAEGAPVTEAPATAEEAPPKATEAPAPSGIVAL